MRLFDTHTHFDLPEYDSARPTFVQRALQANVTDVVLIGVAAAHFLSMKKAADAIHALAMPAVPAQRMTAHLTMGLHPLYIQTHKDEDLAYLDDCLSSHHNVAIAEIGLDAYPDALRAPEIYQRQQRFFAEQLRLSRQHDLPVLLHIRKAHADVLAMLKQAKYNAHNQGGIAHSFSGGEQEALAFARMGFKLGITGQISNLNAKKLHRAVRAVVKKYGISALVIETDCPDMMPVPCQHLGDFNEPAHLPHVLSALAAVLDMDKEMLAAVLWQNSLQALKLNS